MRTWSRTKIRLRSVPHLSYAAAMVAAPRCSQTLAVRTEAKPRCSFPFVAKPNRCSLAPDSTSPSASPACAANATARPTPGKRPNRPQHTIRMFSAEHRRAKRLRDRAPGVHKENVPSPIQRLNLGCVMRRACAAAPCPHIWLGMRFGGGIDSLRHHQALRPRGRD